MEQLYTSSEARSKLNVSTSTFKRLVDTGKIRKITPPNRKQGMYVKGDVDKIVEEMRPFARSTRRKGEQEREKKELSTTVDWQKISDLPAILKLDLKVYQENIVGDIALSHELRNEIKQSKQTIVGISLKRQSEKGVRQRKAS